MSYNPRLGFLLFFTGDHRKLNVVVVGITSLSAVSAVLVQGASDVSSTYITSTITSAGNIIQTDDIGGKASMPPGNYRYYISGTSGSMKISYYLDILVLAKDLSQLPEIPLEDYNPLVEEFTIFEGDSLYKIFIVPSADFSAVTGKLYQDSTDVTATYCSGSAIVSGATISTHTIGGQASIPAADYMYIVTGTYNNSESVASWYWKVKVLPKQSIL